MAQVRFISGDGVEHEVEEGSAAAEIMRNAGFQQLGVGEPEVEPEAEAEAEAEAMGGDSFTYTLEDAIAQNNGVDESTEAKAKSSKAKPAKAQKVDE